MGGSFTTGLLFNGPACADMIRMRMGKNEPGNLPGIPAGLFYIVENNGFRTGNAAVNEANLTAEN
jgi:hypothetical protein